MPAELSPEVVVRRLQLGDPAARARLEECCRAPLGRLVERLLAPAPGEGERLTRRTLRWLEMYLRARSPYEFREMGDGGFRTQLLVAAWRMLSDAAAAGPRPAPPADAATSAGAYHVRLFFQPLGAVGGDWLDIEAGEAGELWVIVADVMGKGVPANLLANGLSHLWRAARAREARRQGRSPAELLALLGADLEECLPDDVFVEASLGRFMAEGRATVASAGACPVVVRQARAEMHALGGPPLGLADVRGPCGERGWHLRAGDELLLASDGLFDQRAGGARLRDRLPGLLDRPDAPGSLHEAVANELRQAVEAHGQDDDIALVTVALRAPEASDAPV
jgi:hypothetical protein